MKRLRNFRTARLTKVRKGDALRSIPRTCGPGMMRGPLRIIPWKKFLCMRAERTVIIPPIECPTMKSFKLGYFSWIYRYD